MLYYWRHRVAAKKCLSAAKKVAKKLLETIRTEHIICKKQKTLFFAPLQIPMHQVRWENLPRTNNKSCHTKAFHHILTYTGNSFMVWYSELQTTSYFFYPYCSVPVYLQGISSCVCVCPCTLLHWIYSVRDGWVSGLLEKTTSLELISNWEVFFQPNSSFSFNEITTSRILKMWWHANWECDFEV